MSEFASLIGAIIDDSLSMNRTPLMSAIVIREIDNEITRDLFTATPYNRANDNDLIIESKLLSSELLYLF